jgi:hypothetical protein
MRLDQRSNEYLNGELNRLAMLYDDEYNAVMTGTSWLYTQADLDWWDRQITEIEAILKARPIANPTVTYMHGFASSTDRPLALYWWCSVKDDAWTRLISEFCYTEQEARVLFRAWCSAQNIDPATVPDSIYLFG